MKQQAPRRHVSGALVLAAGMLVWVLAAPFAHAGGADLGYSRSADPFADVNRAMARANADGRRILVIAGGDWCEWCYVLDRYLKRNADVNQALNEAFVVVKVYLGEEGPQEEFFSRLPTAVGAPHFWVLSAGGEVLASQNTGELEAHKSYDKVKFMHFISQWREPH